MTWAHPVAAVLDMGEKNGKYRHRVLFSSEKVWTVKKMDFTIQFIKMNTRAELKSVKSCPCHIGGDQAINALNANGIHDQDNLGHWSDQYPQDEEPTITDTEPPITEAPITRTEAPITETEAPVTETEAPVTETEAPVTETEPPITETEAPVTETEAPVTETEPLITETEPTITETEAPVTETEPPITETEPQITETEAPVTETEPPVTETEPTITETEPPITETEAPVTETQPSVTELPLTAEPQIPKVVKTMKSNIVVAINTPFSFTRRVNLFFIAIFMLYSA